MKELDQYFEKMENIANIIINIYEDVKNFSSELQQTYLSLSIEYENDLFYKINQVKNMYTMDDNDLIARYHSHILRHQLNKVTEIKLLNRFTSYYDYQKYHLPFLSNNKKHSKKEREIENQKIIEYHAKCDYLCNCIVLFSESIENSKNKIEQREFLRGRNSILSVNKNIEIINPKNIKNKESINLLLDLGHNADDIEIIYGRHEMQETINMFCVCIYYTDELLKSAKNRACLKAILIHQKAILNLCDEQECDEIYNSLYRRVITVPENQEAINNSSKSINNLLMILSDKEQKNQHNNQIKKEKTSEKI